MIFDGTTGAGDPDHRPRRPARRPPRLVEEHGRSPNTIAFTVGRPGRQHHRPAAGHGRHRLHPVQRRRPGARPRRWSPRSWGRTATTRPSRPTGTCVVYDESTCTNGTPTAGQPADKSCDADTDATATICPHQPAAGTDAHPAHQRQQPRRRRQRRHGAHQLVPQVGAVRRAARRAAQARTGSPSRRRASTACARPPAPADTDETNKGTLIWMVGISPGDRRRRSRASPPSVSPSRTSPPRTTSPSGRSSSSRGPVRMGTLGGFPNPPATSSVGQSPTALTRSRAAPRRGCR